MRSMREQCSSFFIIMGGVGANFSHISRLADGEFL